MANDTVMLTDAALSETARRYDAFRKSIPFIQRPNILLLTCGVTGTFPDEVPMILKTLKEYNTFTEGNDPWHEHDFGVFEFKGKKLIWKIDDYGGHEGYELVLTVMLASEY